MTHGPSRGAPAPEREDSVLVTHGPCRGAPAPERVDSVLVTHGPCRGVPAPERGGSVVAALGLGQVQSRTSWPPGGIRVLALVRNREKAESFTCVVFTCALHLVVQVQPFSLMRDFFFNM